MAGVEIQGSDGTQAQVTTEQELLTIESPYPPLMEQKVKPIRLNLTDDGTPTGSNDIGAVSGTLAVPVPFWIPADPADDTYVVTLSIIVGYGASAEPYQWADGAALTNGLLIGYDSGAGEQAVAEGIVNNQDMFRLALGQGMVPTGWEVRGVNALQDYGYFIQMDLTKLMPPYGVKLDAGSDQKLFCQVRDSIAAATDSFNIIAYGFKRFK